MKNIINKVGFISMLLLIFMSSCKKDFLDKNPTDQLAAETFYSSKSSIDMALTACYGSLKSCLFTWNMPALDCLTDNAYSTGNYYNATSLSQGPVNPTAGGYIDSVYLASYANIARYNIFLQTLSAYNVADLSAAIKIQYEAEVRLLRALKYFDLYKFYGSIPLVTVPLTLATQYQPKVPATDILAQINTDIDFAIANLPDIAYKNANGHLVKSSAQVLKARVLLFDAYDASGSAISSAMDQVKTVTSDIISKGYYSIAPSFRGLFCDDLGQQTGNPEFIYSVNYLAGIDVPIPFNIYGVAGNYLGTATSVWPLANFANEFEFVDGTPFSVSNPLYDATNVYKNRDPRMAKTIFTGTVTFENGYTSNNMTQTVTGYNYYKGVEGADAQNIYSNLNGSDWPLMRYAEVLLMYAEAANEVGGPDASVYSAVNQIRNRADILMPPLPAGLSQIQMRAAIRHERRIELAFEGFRYDDLKRWKIAEQVLNIPASESVVVRSFLPINYHLPLPQIQIDINHGALIQNPDYK